MVVRGVQRSLLRGTAQTTHANHASPCPTLVSHIRVARRAPEISWLEWWKDLASTPPREKPL